MESSAIASHVSDVLNTILEETITCKLMRKRGKNRLLTAENEWLKTVFSEFRENNEFLKFKISVLE